MGNPCKVCKGMESIGKNDICVRCAKDRASSSAAPVIDGSGEGGSNTSRRRIKQVKMTAASSPSQELSAQNDEDIQSDHLPHESHGLDNSLGRTDVVSIQGQSSLLEYESMDPEDQLSPPETDYQLIIRSCLSGAQNERVNALIQKVKPETVVFVAVMKNCDVKSPRPLLIISKERTLVEGAHFPHESGMPVTLQIPDKSEEWHPRFYMEKGEGMLAGDWLGFVCDNHVQVGDMCIFVPSKGSESSMFTVHVLRAKATPPKDAVIGSAVNTVGPYHGGNVSPESNIHGFPHDIASAVNTVEPSHGHGGNVNPESNIHGFPHDIGSAVNTVEPSHGHGNVSLESNIHVFPHDAGSVVNTVEPSHGHGVNVSPESNIHGFSHDIASAVNTVEPSHGHGIIVS